MPDNLERLNGTLERDARALRGVYSKDKRHRDDYVTGESTANPALEQRLEISLDGIRSSFFGGRQRVFALRFMHG